MNYQELEKELIENIGTHVLKVFNNWMKDPKGKKIIAPISLPRKKTRDEWDIIYPRYENWMMRVEVSAPSLIKVLGPGKWEHLSVEEYFKEIEKK